MLMRSEPFTEVSRLAQQLFGPTPTGTWSRPTAMPVDAFRNGDEFVIAFDLPGVDADALADAAEAGGTPVVKGSTCFIDGRGRDAVRLAYSACPAGDMDEGIARLAALL